MGLWIFLIWLVGLFAAVGVHRVRAGIPLFVVLKVRDVFELGFFYVLGIAIKSLFWPIDLVVWFLRGRPAPNVVFGAKAERRMLQQQQ